MPVTRNRPFCRSERNYIGSFQMNSDPKSETYAAVDLGSNSFHMLIARREHGEMKVLDRIKEMVRLGGGLDRRGHLD